MITQEEYGQISPGKRVLNFWNQPLVRSNYQVAPKPQKNAANVRIATMQ
jgi:hypothetical protein